MLLRFSITLWLVYDFENYINETKEWELINKMSLNVNKQFFQNIKFSLLEQIFKTL